MARILIAAQFEVDLCGIAALLATRADWSIVAKCLNVRDTVAAALRLSPDLCILELSLPKGGALEAAKEIARVLPHVSILVLAPYPSEMLTRALSRAGNVGYLLKSMSGEVLIEGVENALSKVRGETVLTDRSSGPDQTSTAKMPTAREREVLRLIAEGFNSRQIAATLGISRRTVEKHRANVMHKLGLRTLSEIVRYAIVTGLISSSF